MDILEALTTLFGYIWKFFTDVTVPGLGVPFSSLLIATIIARISIALAHQAFGVGGESYRAGSARNPKISENRRGDKF